MNGIAPIRCEQDLTPIAITCSAGRPHANDNTHTAYHALAPTSRTCTNRPMAHHAAHWCAPRPIIAYYHYLGTPLRPAVAIAVCV